MLMFNQKYWQMNRLIFFLLLCCSGKAQNSILDLIPPNTLYGIEINTPLDTILITEEVVPILTVMPLNYVKTKHYDGSISQVFTIDGFTLWLTFPEYRTGIKPFIQIYRTVRPL